MKTHFLVCITFEVCIISIFQETLLNLNLWNPTNGNFQLLLKDVTFIKSNSEFIHIICNMVLNYC